MKNGRPLDGHFRKDRDCRAAYTPCGRTSLFVPLRQRRGNQKLIGFPLVFVLCRGGHEASAVASRRGGGDIGQVNLFLLSLRHLPHLNISLTGSAADIQAKFLQTGPVPSGGRHGAGRNFLSSRPVMGGPAGRQPRQELLQPQLQPQPLKLTFCSPWMVSNTEANSASRARSSWLTGR